MSLTVKKAIILAGGLGTRLRGVVSDRPKSMAPIHGSPFLSYQFDYLIEQGVEEIILSTGFLGEMIREHFGKEYKSAKLSYVVEETPLGTGGGLLKAASTTTGHAFMMNGDSLFKIPLKTMEDALFNTNPSAVLALRRVEDAGRYGKVLLSEQNRITAFMEKTSEATPGLINGGIYLADTQWLKTNAPAEKFSIEKDIFARMCEEQHFAGIEFDHYFIDIGVPEDYRRAQNEFEK